MKLVFFRLLGDFLITVFVFITLTFFAMKALPGGPFDTEKAVPQQIKENLYSHYKLNEPLWAQYSTYLKSIVRGDLGESYRYVGGRTVSSIIIEGLCVSFPLGLFAIITALLVALPLGLFSAFKKNSILDKSCVNLANTLASLPNFLFAAFLIKIFSLKLNWFPPALWDGPRSMVLPTLTLALRPAALLFKLTRNLALDVLRQDYIRTAWAKGLSWQHTVFKHVLKNTLIPVITALGPLVASLVTGSFVVEVVFALPGLGKHFVSSILDRDYNLVMGVTIVYGFFLIVINRVIDVLYVFIDPRIRHELS